MKQQISNRELTLDRLLLGDANAFQLLYDTYSPLLYGVILDIVQDSLLANDILTRVFVQATLHINQYDSSKMRIFTWLSQIARKECIYAGNLDRGKKPTGEKEPINKGLRNIISEMDEEDQRFIELSYYRNYSISEIATTSGISLELAKGSVLQALRRLGARIAAANALWLGNTKH